ncbi:TonB-dependent receptor [Pseudoxanthomonas sp.]|uniref:TonB-dependent receptor n=1 Tax=Pseudoxanthomonas sp. TaxID=1871049 RepID=UPI0025871BD3|nr:TonB-dependent receptor [Pseudoxanthomonas sp.]MCR6685062.1 TonB-dependent receptor [Pseudoxanthomonas sp.]
MLVIGASATAPAIAQDEPASASQPQARELDTVQVTSSRIKRGGFIAPTPTTQISAEAIETSGLPSVADLINTMPAARPSLTPVSTVNNASWSGGNYMDLRGLGYSRTLVLVDGKRYVPTQITGVVDINVVPQALLQGVDIVTGGASASWGSDAVAGVVNLRFDHQLDGIKGQLQYGSSDAGDYTTRKASFALGHAFADDRGHLLLGVEASDNDGIARLGDRDWGAKGWGTITNPAYTADNDEPRILVVPGVVSSNTSFGGVITSGPLRGIQFDPDGKPVPFEYGDVVSGSSMIGGDGAYTHTEQTLAAPTERRTAYSRLSWDFTDNLTGFLEGSWSRSEASPIPNLTRSDTSIRIYRDNAFLDESVGQMMDEAGITSFTMGRLSRDYARTVNHKESTTRRFAAGLEGWLDNGWSWDAYYSHGTSETMLLADNNRITSRYNAAIDAVFDQASGQIVCRSAAARAIGCVPMDLFGEGAPSAEARAWVTGTSWRLWDISQDAAAATLSGDLFELPAGPLSMAAGVEWRSEEAAVTSDEFSVRAEFVTGNTVPWAGKVEVKEAFTELSVPLARDATWADEFSLNAAARVTDYSTSGTVSTWKAGATWDIDPRWRLRATRSRDIRAPSLEELFSGSTTSTFSVLDPELGSTYSVSSLSSGNPDLEPEEADTFTAGVVFSPTSNLTMSVDFYDIDMAGAIIELSAATIVERCYSIQPQLCGLVSRGDDGRIDQVQATPQNLQKLKLRGTDFELLYNRDIGPGQMRLRTLLGYTDSLSLDDGEVVTEMAGTVDQPTISSIGGMPYWNGNAHADYRLGPALFGVGLRYVGGGRIDRVLTEKDRNIIAVGSRTYLDLNASYNLGEHVSLFASVRNLADRDPPIVGGGFATVRSLYDVVGRYYSAGVRLDF